MKILSKEELRNIYEQECCATGNIIDMFEIFCKGYEVALKTCTNKKKDNYSYDIVSKYFVYDESSPSCIRTVRGGSTGNITKHGYYAFTIIDDNKTIGTFSAHRVAAVLNNMQVQNAVIDHIDGNRLNNLISNLRAVSPKQNSRNRKIRNNNWYGISGVYFRESKNIPYFIASGYVNSTRIEKLFSIKKLGVMPAFASAVEFRKHLIEEAEKDGFIFSERHKSA